MEENKEEELPKFRGLYRHVNISVKALDYIIIACIAVILIVVGMELRNPGMTVTFDSKGGSDVASIKQDYGDHLELVEEPTREGYEFTGWYKDSACDNKWNQDNDIIEDNLTLYAGWKKIE